MFNQPKPPELPEHAHCIPHKNFDIEHIPTVTPLRGGGAEPIKGSGKRGVRKPQIIHKKKWSYFYTYSLQLISGKAYVRNHPQDHHLKGWVL